MATSSFFDYTDGTARAGYTDDNKKRVDFDTTMNIYSDIIQKLPNHR